MNKKYISLLIILVIVLFTFSACGKKTESTTSQEEQNIETFYVKSEKVKEISFKEELSFPAKADPFKSVTITAKANGEIQSTTHEVGDYINEGDILLTIDPENHQINFNNASLMVEQTKINLQNAKLNFDRNKELYNIGSISKVAFENSENAYKQANIAYKNATNNYKQAKIAFDNTTIKSPISGYIAKQNFNVGENVAIGTPLLTVVDTSKLEITIGVPEKNIDSMKVGQSAKLKPQYSDIEYTGQVTSISPVMDEMTNNYITKVIVDNPDNKIKSGMSVDVKILINEDKKSPAFNKLALILYGNQKYVYINDNGKAKLVPVTVGVSNDDYYEILSGLKIGDEVITEGSGMLEDGATIEINNSNK